MERDTAHINLTFKARRPESWVQTISAYYFPVPTPTWSAEQYVCLAQESTTTKEKRNKKLNGPSKISKEGGNNNTKGHVCRLSGESGNNEGNSRACATTESERRERRARAPGGGTCRHPLTLTSQSRTKKHRSYPPHKAQQAGGMHRVSWD